MLTIRAEAPLHRPTFRVIGSPKRWDRGAALTSTLHCFVTELLTREENVVGLALNRELIGQAETMDHPDRVMLDTDSSERSVDGRQKAVPPAPLLARPQATEPRL
jgi:hypothetical protein